MSDQLGPGAAALGDPSGTLAGQAKFTCRAWQIKCAAMQLVLVLVFLAGMLLCQFGYTSRLFTHPMGIKMTAFSGVWLGVGFALGFGCCWLLDARVAAWGESHKTVRAGLLGLLGALQVYFFALPAIQVIVVGPGAISAMEHMLKP